MEQLSPFKIAEQFSDAIEIPISFFQNNELIFKAHSGKQDFNLPMFLVRSLPKLLPDIWVSRSPEYLFFGGLKLKDPEFLLLAGPVTPHELSVGQCRMILQRIGLRPREASSLQTSMSRFSYCDVPQLRKYLSFLNYVLNGNDSENIEGIDFNWKNILSVPEEYFVDITSKADDDIEKHMMEYVKTGKVRELEDYFNENFLRKGNDSQKGRGMHKLELRRNYIFGALILISRTAIQEGLDSDIAKNYASFYMELLYKADNLADLDHIFYKLALDYTKRINDLHDCPFEDPLARRIYRFVRSHLYVKLSTAVIADEFKMNESYLSKEFKKTTGKTVTDFILESKIREAKLLLEKGYTSTEVSDMLRFSSPSYFGVIFKKVTGLTPVEYKKINLLS